MRVMFNQAFATITLFFAGLSEFMSAFSKIGELANESAGLYVDQVRLERQAAIDAALKPIKAK